MRPRRGTSRFAVEGRSAGGARTQGREYHLHPCRRPQQHHPRHHRALPQKKALALERREQQIKEAELEERARALKRQKTSEDPAASMASSSSSSSDYYPSVGLSETAPASSFVKLNVGGTIFQTHHSTLTNCGSAVFQRLLANDGMLGAERDQDGCLLVSAHSELSDACLSLLTTPPPPPPPSGPPLTPPHPAPPRLTPPHPASPRPAPPPG